MKRSRLAFALLGLGFGLLFYLAHRSDCTLSNRLLRGFCGNSLYGQLKCEARRWLPVPLGLRGCLPSALWCFIVTSLVGGWRFRVGRWPAVQLAWWCPLFNAAWECIQWIGWTDGRGDWLDVVAGFAGWAVAHTAFARASEPMQISSLWTWRLGVAVAGFASMGFADVWK